MSEPALSHARGRASSSAPSHMHACIYIYIYTYITCMLYVYNVIHVCVYIYIYIYMYIANVYTELIHCNSNLLTLSLNMISGDGVSLCGPYTRSPLQDSRLFGPRPWKILAATYEQMGS